MDRILSILKRPPFKFTIKKHAALSALGLIIPVLALLLFLFLSNYSNSINQGLADNLIRLHVVANSDSKEDQDLKLKVRDAVVDYMEFKLKDSHDIERTKFLINENMEGIREAVDSRIKGGGKDYSVDISLGVYPFPEKQYGDVTLPSGYYQALKVIIGKGGGANWWCVLFPPLCFIDASHGKVPDSLKTELKKSLTAEEYKIVTSSGDNADIPVRIKFKIVEIFQDAKIRFTNFFSKLSSGVNMKR